MEVDVIDDADKGIKQRASGRCKHPLSKGGQERIDVHVGWKRDGPDGGIGGSRVKSLYISMRYECFRGIFDRLHHIRAS